MIAALVILYAVGFFVFVYLDGRYEILDHKISDVWVLYFLWPVVLPVIGLYKLGLGLYVRGKVKRSDADMNDR